MINVKREILMLKKKWYATNQRDNLEHKSTHQLVKTSKRFENFVTFYSLHVSFSVDVAICTGKIESLIFPKGRSSSIGAYKKAISSGG